MNGGAIQQGKCASLLNCPTEFFLGGAIQQGKMASVGQFNKEIQIFFGFFFKNSQVSDSLSHTETTMQVWLIFKQIKFILVSLVKVYQYQYKIDMHVKCCYEFDNKGLRCLQSCSLSSASIAKLPSFCFWL
jgi:hypothetical protein